MKRFTTKRVRCLADIARQRFARGKVFFCCPSGYIINIYIYIRKVCVCVCVCVCVVYASVSVFVSVFVSVTLYVYMNVCCVQGGRSW